MSNSVHGIIEAANIEPGFIGAFRAAPAQVSIDGKTYQRDAARNTQERVWYLAVVAMQNPKAIFRLKALDGADLANGFDESEVDSDSGVQSARAARDASKTKVSTAQDTLSAAETTLDAAKAAVVNGRQLLQAKIEEVAGYQREVEDLKRVKDAGDFAFALLTVGGSKLAPLADKEVKIGQANNWISTQRGDVLPGLINAQQSAQSARDSAKKALDSAKMQLAKDEKAVTAAEEKVRQRLRDAENKVAAEASAKAAQDARDRAQAAAAAAAAAGAGSFGDYGGGDGGFGPDWGTQDWATTDPNAELGTPEYLDADEQADLWGDPDYAYAMAELNDEPIVGVNTVISPYAFDRYYAGYDLEDDPVWGADTAGIVGGIIAGVAAAAPAIYKAVAPPPSKDDTSAAANSGSGNLVDDLLEKVGAKKTIDDAAKAAGGSAGEKGAGTAGAKVDMWLGVAVVVGLAIAIAHSS